jgi:hypothetical protein
MASWATVGFWRTLINGITLTSVASWESDSCPLLKRNNDKTSISTYSQRLIRRAGWMKSNITLLTACMSPYPLQLLPFILRNLRTTTHKVQKNPTLQPSAARVHGWIWQTSGHLLTAHAFPIPSPTHSHLLLTSIPGAPVLYSGYFALTRRHNMYSVRGGWTNLRC